MGPYLNTARTFFIVVLTTTSCILYSCTAQPTSRLLNVEEFEAKLKSDKDVIVLDVRTDNEVALGVIEGATQLNFRSEGFKSKLSNLDPKKTYLVYCAAGGRSGKTTHILAVSMNNTI